MSAFENSGIPFGWFFSRRQTGALILMVLLLLSGAAQAVLMCIHGISAAAPAPFVVTLLALAISPWWSLPTVPAYPQPDNVTKGNLRRWTLLVAGGAAALALWPRSAQLNQGLSSYEIAEVTNGIWGRWKVQADGKKGFHAVTWDEALDLSDWSRELAWKEDWRSTSWDRLEAQAGHWLLGGTWDGSKPPKEYAFRVVPWISGVLTAGCLALLGAILSSPRAGLAAGLILAVHPLHIRWSTEIGSASTMLLSVVAALLCLIQALRTDRWRWWLALVATQAVCRFCDGHALGVLTVMNVAGACVALGSRSTIRDRLSHFFRVIAVFALAASWPAGHARPSLPSEPMPGSVSGAETSALTVCGLHLSNPEEGADSAGTAQAAFSYGWRRLCVRQVIPTLALAGLLFLVIQNWRTRLVALGLGGGIIFLDDRTSLMLSVLLLPLTLAWAGESLTKIIPRQKRLLHAPLLMGMLYSLTILPALQRVMALPRLPLREVAAAAMRQGGLQAITATVESSLEFYDPGVHFIQNIKDLDSLTNTAWEQERTLMVYCRPAQNDLPEAAPVRDELEKSGRFQLLEEFTAVEPVNYYRLYRYHPREKIIHLNLKPEK